ncbi:MAG: response regulator transcription factor [Candidatus Dormiibacterota bacterium]
MLALIPEKHTSLAIMAEDEISRRGLFAQLRHRPDIELVRDGDEPHATVTVLLADEVDGDAVRQVRQIRRSSSSRVVMIVSRLDEGALLDALEAGVTGLLRRSQATSDAVAEAVQSAAQGTGSIPADLVSPLLEHVGRLQREVLLPRGISFTGLTARETDVLRLIADGCDTAEVGRSLFVSERTVKSILHDITSRLNLRNRTHAVAYALRQGLI